jgi:phosphoribosyl 1,2-cyclic phosphate phosphodiesterase
VNASLLILGSGTSMGVPTLGCACRTCTSADPRDRRLRPSAAIEWEDRRVLIDTGPDFREQALRHGIREVDAVFYTHSHADHILGLDDLRPLTFLRNGRMPLYADDPTADVLERIFTYVFAADATYPTRPRVELHRLRGPVSVAGATFHPVPLLHGDLEVTGFRFGNAAYLTDMSSIPEASLPLLDGVETVVLDALRYTPHPSHASVDDAIGWARRLGASRVYFTHMSHEILHAEAESRLPSPMRLTYDGLRIPFEL